MSDIPYKPNLRLDFRSATRIASAITADAVTSMGYPGPWMTKGDSLYRFV